MRIFSELIRKVEPKGLSALPGIFKLIPFLFFIFCLEKAKAQTPAFDFGAGTAISVGFQDEWAVGVRTHYHWNRWSGLAEYNLFFQRDATSQNTAHFNEIALGVNYYLTGILGISVSAGLGYVGNNFDLNENDPDTSTLYFKSGNFNHGAQLKLLGNIPLGKRIKIYAEMNFKSFGRRYDTFAFGLLYSIPM